jgi:NAD(P)-dependent dehydrogenase (short-subunit alcohol dehydrogenase family)
MTNLFDLSGRVAIITGGAGLLGEQHARAILGAGGHPVLVDIDEARAVTKARALAAEFGLPVSAFGVDITNRQAVEPVLEQVLAQHGRVDILINNAANNPKMENTASANFSRFENFPQQQWDADIAVGVGGAFVCSQVFGTEMARRGSGVIVNISSDLGLIAPDQRLYRTPDTPEHLQPVKPVTYSIVKSALIGLTKYLATYWAKENVRVNAICPGGVENGQSPEFMAKLRNLIPMGRMANVDEYQGAMLFLCSDASSYMTGATLVVDGGRTCW